MSREPEGNTYRTRRSEFDDLTKTQNALSLLGLHLTKVERVETNGLDGETYYSLDVTFDDTYGSLEVLEDRTSADAMSEIDRAMALQTIGADCRPPLREMGEQQLEAAIADISIVREEALAVLEGKRSQADA